MGVLHAHGLRYRTEFEGINRRTDAKRNGSAHFGGGQLFPPAQRHYPIPHSRDLSCSEGIFSAQLWPNRTDYVEFPADRVAAPAPRRSVYRSSTAAIFFGSRDGSFLGRFVSARSGEWLPIDLSGSRFVR